MIREVYISIKSIFEGLLDTFTVKLVPAVLIPTGGFLFGFENLLSLQALLVLVALDFITGLCSAKISREEIQSKKAVKSAFKVAIYGLLVSAAHLTETIAPGTTFMVETMATFLALTELISILENVGKMGFAIPKRLLNKLHEWRDDEDPTLSNKTKINI